MPLHFPIKAEEFIKSNISSIRTSGLYSEGQWNKLSSQKISQMVNGRYSVLTSSWGTGFQAVLYYYKSLGYTNVVFQSNTFYGSVMVARNLGFTITYVPTDHINDIFNMEPGKLTTTLKNLQHIKSVVVLAHIGGWANTSTSLIRRICDMFHSPLIEDCAHSFMVKESGDKFTGTIGNVGIYSFYATKSINAGEGGAIVTEDSSLLWFLQKYITYDRYSHHNLGKTEATIQEYGNNIRISEFQALTLFSVLENYQEFVIHRRNCIEPFKEVLKDVYPSYRFSYKELYEENLLETYKTNLYKLPVDFSKKASHSTYYKYFTDFSRSGPCFDYTCPVIDEKLGRPFLGISQIEIYKTEQERKENEFLYLSTIY